MGYGQVQILWDISLNVGKGEIVTVLGPNGAGKSTLLQTVIGLNKPMNTGNSNSIAYQGKRIAGLKPEQVVRMGIAMVTEDKHLFPDMTVLNNLKMGAFIPRARGEKNQRLQEIFDLFPRLQERKHQMAKTLSGGEKQMLAISRALMSKPDLLLIDEPSIGLQPLLITKTFDVIKDVRDKGVTILLVEQNVFFSLEVSDRAYVLENGRFVMEGPAQDLVEDDHIKKAYLAM